MKLTRFQFTWIVTVVLVGMRLMAQSLDSRPDTPVTTIGEIIANDVYVRSGDSLNHYTICKLQAGDKVTVVAERGEWLEILPPDGAFSLVSGDFVDTTDNQTGTVNGDNVRVRAGSLLNENKYTVQTLLPKGTPVTILGRNPDGFVRIKPPAGATVWVNRTFVKMPGATDGSPSAAVPIVSGSEPTSDKTGVEANTLAAGATETTAEPKRTDAASAMSSPPAAATKTLVTAVNAGLRRQLEEVDEAARAELAKPIDQRKFAPILSRYRPIAEQSADVFAQEYAKARLAQLDNAAALADAIAKVNNLDEKAKSFRYESLAARSLIPEPTPLTEPAGIEVQGVLKVSALYPPGSPTPRYRLIDPAEGDDRTIGYVEIPADAGINVDAFLGRFVGVRASAQRIQTGGVNPIPIFIARELVLMDPPRSSKLSQATP